MTPLEALPGFPRTRYATDCYGGGEPAGVPCPRCGRDLTVRYECRIRRPPSRMTASCVPCEIWFDLGESPFTDAVDVSREAVRRARELLRPKAVQTTLEGWA